MARFAFARLRAGLIYINCSRQALAYDGFIPDETKQFIPTSITKMVLLRRTFTKRSAVLTVLLMWIFALSAGWANACLLQDRGTHTHASSNGISPGAQILTVSAGHVGAVAGHDDAPASGKAPCHKVCDEMSQSMVKAPSPFDMTDPGLAAPGPTPWTAHASAFFELGSPFELPPPTAGPPLRIQYSRLAL